MVIEMQTSHRFYAQNILDFIENSGVSYQLYTHPPVFTVAEASAVSGKIAGTHTRNLFLRDKREKMFLITLRHETPIDLKKLSNLLGAGKLSFGSPERLWNYLGVKPGSVTPLSILNDIEQKVQLVLEQDMMDSPLINVHPLDNTMTIGFAPSGLMTILEKSGIKPIIMNLDAAAPDKTSKDTSQEC
jgi:Ala-tRNA(Pro) deacylase